MAGAGKIMPIHRGASYNVYVPTIDFFANKIINQNYFTYVKLSVEWWMLVAKALRAQGLGDGAILKDGFDKKIIPSVARGMYKEWMTRQKGNRKYKSDPVVIERILEMSVSPKPENFFLGVTDRCTVNNKTFPLPFRSKNVPRLIEGMLPKGEVPIHALPFRIWAVTAQIDEFIKKIKHKNIVIVGPSHLENFGYKLKLDNFNFIKIHNTNATLHVKETKAKIKKLHNKFLSAGGDVTYFFVGGGAAMWLITELHGELKNASLIDIGRAFDVYYFYDPIMRKFPNWMFGQWLKRGNTAWVRNRLVPDKNGVYCIK